MSKLSHPIRYIGVDHFLNDENRFKMEKFMFLFRGGENHAHNAQDSQAATDNMQAWMTWMEELAEKGKLVGGEPLEHTGKQVNGSNKVVSDGPYVVGQEFVGGYVIVSANDINEAVEISKGCPIFAEDGKLEVRQLRKMEM